jgi:hypothetical protein
MPCRPVQFFDPTPALICDLALDHCFVDDRDTDWGRLVCCFEGKEKVAGSLWALITSRGSRA